ncbi:MAG: NADH-quinone oxidoreductase subunit M [Chloroflexota bacterium]|nr:NADH-quinone oxidoreductase subunit M [Chloroflexota bacterium]
MVLNQTFADEQIGFPILTTLIVLPLLWALLLALIRDDRLLRTVALTGALVQLGLALIMAYQFVPAIADIQFAEQISWMPALGSSYHIGVDGISVLFVPLTCFLTVLLVLYASGVRFLTRFYLINLLLLQAFTIGIFVSLDLLLFFVFWELALVPSYFMIKRWGIGPQRQYAGTKYVLYMLVGSLPLLIAIVLLGLNHHQATGAYSFDLLTLQAGIPIPLGHQTLIFFLMMAGFAIKGPMLPFHTWVPTTLMEGPFGMGVYLLGLKLGVYGMLRFVIPLLPEASAEWFWLVAVLGLTALLYGALIALVQPNFRRLLAFASVSHVGIILVGLFSLNQQGMQGALIQMISVGIVGGGLMLLTGFLYRRTGSSDLSALGGLARHVPVLAFFFFVCGLAFIGLPGTSGFIGEFLILMGAFRVHWAFAAVGVLGVILSAGYFLWYYERAFFGPVTNAAVSRLRDLNPREMLIAASICGLIFWIGLYPKPLLEMTRGSVESMVARVEQARVGTIPDSALPNSVLSASTIADSE